ncbi:unnamed protein product, partial [Cyprideis torosa]
TAPELLELFWNDELLRWVCTESNQYAIREGRDNPEITIEELRTFLSILLLSGYMSVPNYRMYWGAGRDARNDLVLESMSRDRFEVIKRNLHFCGTPNKEDRYWKLRPLIQALQTSFMETFVPQEDVCHDEAMVKYFKRHGLKQAIRNKPIRFGFKAWPWEENVKIAGRSGASLLDLQEHMRDDVVHLPFHFHIDNYFTSLDLMTEMERRGYHVTGTIRPNRIPGNPPLLGIEAFKKKERGYFESTSTSDGKILLTRWMDNSTVTLASSLLGDQPVGQVKRYSRKDKKSIMVRRPAVVKQYNDAMGGTDRMDQHINHCRVSVGGKKWWWALFTWMLDASVQNAWRLHRGAGGQLTLVQFRREVVCYHLERAASLRKTSSGGSATTRRGAPAGLILRYDNVGHLIIVAPNKAQGICQECHVSKPTSKCVKCNVFLCWGCFASYHKP